MTAHAVVKGIHTGIDPPSSGVAYLMLSETTSKVGASLS